MSSHPSIIEIELRDSLSPEQMAHTLASLQQQISLIGVDDVRRKPSASSEELVLAKGDLLSLGSLIVSIGSAGVFTAMIELLKIWTSNRDNRKVSLKVKKDGKELELELNAAILKKDTVDSFVQAALKLLDYDEQKDRTST